LPIEIVWSPLALSRLQEIQTYVARDKPEAAARLATRLVAIVEALSEHPYLGRMGAESGLRELVIGGTPYVVLYRVRANRVIINTIWHGARRAKSE
jgi:toxin ParE1/3/4